MTSMTGLRNVLHDPSWETLICILSTFSSALLKTSETSVTRHSLCATWASLIRTRSPFWMSDCVVFHLRWVCKVGRYSRLQRYQDWSTRLCTYLHFCLKWLPSENTPIGRGNPTSWVSSMAGVSIKGESGLVDTGVSGLALIIEEISAMNVQRTSWERGWHLSCINMESSILRTSLSCAPRPRRHGVDWIPMCKSDPWGISVPQVPSPSCGISVLCLLL